jgi:purine-binding chemotaxis protein CheW
MQQTISADSHEKKTSVLHQYSTFYVNKRLYGIDVTKVQEVVKAMPITSVPHAPDFVIGLINLRGQIATAIGVMELFGLGEKSHPQMMNIVCNIENNLVSLQVDEIGDVMEVSSIDYESPPSTLPDRIRSLLSGVYKTEDSLLSVIDLTKVSERIGIKKTHS